MSETDIITNLIETRYHYEHINNVFSTFFFNSLSYFSYLYPRFTSSLVATYDKAVAYLKNKDELGREGDLPNLPFIMLIPGDINISDNSGLNFFRFPNLAPGLLRLLYYPIYEDSNVTVTLGFSRFKGEFELLIYLNSYYEFLDLKVLLLQIFGGLNRIISPITFDSFITISDELLNYEYNNEYTDESYTLDWENYTNSELIKTTDKTVDVYPLTLRPWFKLTSISDSNTFYGGDKQPIYQLRCTIEFECEFPSWLCLQTDLSLENINLNINMGSSYSVYSGYEPPETRTVESIDSTSINNIEVINFKTRYYHIITESESLSETDVEITLPEIILNEELLLVNYRYGLLDYNDHYTIENNGTILKIKVDYVELIKDTVIELYIYD